MALTSTFLTAEEDHATLVPASSPTSEAPPVGLDALGDVVTGLAGASHLWRPAVAAAPDDRDGLRLLSTPEYEVWLLTWPPGSRVQPHDHGDAHGAFVVVSGELCEIRWQRGHRRHRVLPAGRLATVEVGAVHDVVAVGETSACSVHAYSPPLRQMRFYTSDGALRRSIEPVAAGAGLLDAAEAAVALHPVSARG
jgi:quercetin dioxygenase-like cupin family protein